MVSSFFRRLISPLKASSLALASLQAGSLMCLADIVCQKIIEREEQLDLMRMFRFGTIGALIGPTLRIWFNFLDKSIVFNSKVATAAAKMLTDQCIVAPIFLANFILVNSLMQGNSWGKAKSDVYAKYADILLSHYQLWPPVQSVNFMLVPPQYRVLVMQTVAVGWNTYLSWKTNSLSGNEETISFNNNPHVENI